jgi:hypothetical protein
MEDELPRLDEDEPPCVLVDPIQAALIESGYALDSVGALPEFDLLRDGAEPDDIYRTRLLSKWATSLVPVTMTYEDIDQWMRAHEWRGPVGTETTPPEDKPRDTSLRDAIQNNW